MTDLVAAFPDTLQVAAADAVRALPKARLRAMNSLREAAREFSDGEIAGGVGRAEAASTRRSSQAGD